MANGGMFVLRNFYVSFCQNFKGELLSRQQRAGRGHTRRGYVRIFNSLQTAPTHWRSSSWATDLHGKWIKNIDSYTHVYRKCEGPLILLTCSEQWSLFGCCIRSNSGRVFKTVRTQANVPTFYPVSDDDTHSNCNRRQSSHLQKPTSLGSFKGKIANISFQLSCSQ